ncbi:MAG: Gfo/Idh/MocA family oxidoreductase [Gemmatimonadales bacterium]|nr:Gfo/Idh/MocA family oxidoreductase [Gemmatimonadales bacterium]
MTEPPVLRVGLLGCGRIARGVHMPVLQRLPGVRLAVIAEADAAQRAEAAARAGNATVVADYREALSGGGLDAVVVCLPPNLHSPAATAAFAAGCHVYLEKPLAPTLSEARPVLGAWTNSGRVGMIGFNFRFHPQIEVIRARVRAGAIGRVLAVRTCFSILPHDMPEWKRSRLGGGGVLLDLASHHVDLIRFMLGSEVVRVSAAIQSLGGEGDHAALQLELASGVSVQTFASLGSVEEHRLEVFGSAGKLVMDRTELLEPAFEPASLHGARVRRITKAMLALDPRRLLRSPGAEPSFGRALSAFVRAANGAGFDGPDLLDGARSLAVIEAAERSVQSGRVETPDAVTAA